MLLQEAKPLQLGGGVLEGVDHQITMPVEGALQAPLGTRLDQHVDGFPDLLLDVVHDLLLL
jgi:hypothetical protein